MQIKIEKYLYHSFILDIDELNTLEQVLKSGYIMTRESLKEYLSEKDWKQFKERHSINWNGTDAISVTFHPQNIDLIKQYSDIDIYYLRKNALLDSAYEMYISEGGFITLVLDPHILQEYEIKKDSQKLAFELQIIGNIPISYIKAIIQLIRIYEESKDIIFRAKIIKILKKYNLDIPIVDIKSGTVLAASKTCKKRTRKLINQYDNLY